MNRFQEKVAVVTGGRSGIGQAIAMRLRQEGAHVITVQRGADSEQAHICADLAESDAPQAVIAEVRSRIGRLDVLVNNAGMMQSSGLEQLSLEDWNRCISLNLTAPMLMIKAALPLLRESRGAIVNVGSIEGLAANPQHAAYCSSKAGLHGLTRAVAVDHGAEGIRCNAVAPGWIDTDLNQEFIEQQADPADFRQNIGRIHPLARTGRAQEVAAIVAFLAAEESGFITGQVYTVDGGRMAKLSLP